ncbi:hypothetical protein GN244_ATG05658 [Phytophthora infestans]|uniref:Uncharacterized protein n=1 Tax=Phytophthora infestans TaxID=4787 RepID=A0A833WHM6_PHYIN|nr:hypothetical protein GN244_ATG05658 [Phytophthora infestans]KAF4138036.1 hypothetical protein GN958_ATG12989 [Phytophthora infestans]
MKLWKLPPDYPFMLNRKTADCNLEQVVGTIRTGRESAVKRLSAEAVQGAALTLESVHNVHGRHGFATSVLSVGDRVADDVLKEHLQDATGLLVDEARDTLHTTTTCETTDSGLGNTLDVVAKNFAVTLGTALTESLAAFATSRHVT